MPPRTQGGAAQRVGYPARAPSASAMCHGGMAARQMQHHAADRADDVDPQLSSGCAPRSRERRPQSQLLRIST